MLLLFLMNNKKPKPVPLLCLYNKSITWRTGPCTNPVFLWFQWARFQKLLPQKRTLTPSLTCARSWRRVWTHWASTRIHSVRQPAARCTPDTTTTPPSLSASNRKSRGTARRITTQPMLVSVCIKWPNKLYFYWPTKVFTLWHYPFWLMLYFDLACKHLC